MPDRRRPIKEVGSKRKSRQEKKVYLIVCEGTKTEPLYFTEMRRQHKLAIGVEICGTGCNTLSLINQAIKIKASSSTTFDQVWCVFDRDDFPRDNFTNAIFKAESNGLRLAWSNQCFELWYLLHFRYTTGFLDRDSIYRELGTLLGGTYNKNQQGIYKLLYARQNTAIENSKKLEIYQKENGGLPSDSNPWTKVHELIEELINQVVEKT
ncbi:RloB domain-containing protein [Deinococcus sp. D7000]|nr:RloB domain-containing protein [Deinococcus sp. D7000]